MRGVEQGEAELKPAGEIPACRGLRRSEGVNAMGKLLSALAKQTLVLREEIALYTVSLLHPHCMQSSRQAGRY